MTANDADEWISFTSATTILWGRAVMASPAQNAGEKYVTYTSGSTARTIGVAMVTASPRGKPCPVAVSGVVLCSLLSTAATFGTPVVASNKGQLKTSGTGPATGATTKGQIVGYIVEPTFSGNTRGDKVRILLRPGRG